MKTIPEGAATELAKQYGGEPIIVIEAYWTAVPTLYADKDHYEAAGKILSVDGFDNVISLGGSFGTVSVELDDSDGSIKAIIDSIDIHKRPCKIYQAFSGITDRILLMDGEVSSPIRWSEKSRSVNFTVLTRVEGREIGYALEDSEYANGIAWPIVFGSCLRVPAVRITDYAEATLNTKYTQITQADLTQLKALVAAYQAAVTGVWYILDLATQVLGHLYTSMEYQIIGPTVDWDVGVVYGSELWDYGVATEKYATLHQTALAATRHRDELIELAPDREADILYIWDKSRLPDLDAIAEAVAAAFQGNPEQIGSAIAQINAAFSPETYAAGMTAATIC